MFFSSALEFATKYINLSSQIERWQQRKPEMHKKSIVSYTIVDEYGR